MAALWHGAIRPLLATAPELGISWGICKDIFPLLSNFCIWSALLSALVLWQNKKDAGWGWLSQLVSKPIWSISPGLPGFLSPLMEKERERTTVGGGVVKVLILQFFRDMGMVCTWSHKPRPSRILHFLQRCLLPRMLYCWFSILEKKTCLYTMIFMPAMNSALYCCTYYHMYIYVYYIYSCPSGRHKPQSFIETKTLRFCNPDTKNLKKWT